MSECSENTAFITEIWVKYHLLLKLKLRKCTNHKCPTAIKLFSIIGHPIMKILMPFIISHFTLSDVSNCNMLDILSLTDKTFLKDFKSTIKSLTPGVHLKLPILTLICSQQ